VLVFQSRELRDYALRDWESTELRSRATIEAHTKVGFILGKVDALVAQARDGGRPTDVALALRQEIAQIQQEMRGRL